MTKSYHRPPRFPSPAPDPAALLFGAYRRDVLARLLLHPEDSLHVRELARAREAAGDAFLERVLADRKIFIVGGMTLENLLRTGQLRADAADEQELRRLLDSAQLALKDAAFADLSGDSRLNLAYRAMMQAALAAVLASSYRPSTSEPGHHQLPSS